MLSAIPDIGLVTIQEPKSRYERADSNIAVRDQIIAAGQFSAVVRVITPWHVHNINVEKIAISLLIT